MNGCVFCEIVAGRAEASTVAESDRAVAFLDIQPITRGHTIVVPRRHAARLTHLADEDGCAVLRLGQRIAGALYASDLNASGVNLVLSDGEVAGQEVSHVHLHVLPRYPGDGFTFRLPPEHGIRERAELDETAAKLREAWT